MGTTIKDGLYRVNYKTICAGFVVENGRVIICAPILRKKIEFWITKATWVCK